MGVGKVMRLRRIIDPGTKTSVTTFAFSHGTSAPTVLPGLEAPGPMVEAAALGGANCVFVSPGLIEELSGTFAKYPQFGVAVKVSATAEQVVAKMTQGAPDCVSRMVPRAGRGRGGRRSRSHPRTSRT